MAVTKEELNQLENRLDNTIRTMIQDGFKEMKNHMTELFNKDIDHIQAHLTRHDKYHEEHFIEIKTIEPKLTAFRESIYEELDRRDKKVTDNKRFRWEIIVAILAVLVAAGAYLQ